MDFVARAWLEINLDHLGSNLRLLRGGLRDGCDVMAVVKADGYGHGAVKLSEYLFGQGVRHFGVVTLSEGMALRRAGLGGEILVLAYTPPGLAARLIEQDLTQSVFSPEYADALDREAGLAGGRAKIHVKLDTGMTRTGFDCATAGQIDRVAEVYEKNNLIPTGIFSHFSSADDGSDGADAYCLLQLARFRGALDGLKSRGIQPGLRHMCNTGGARKYPDAHFDLVRCGAALAGYNTACGVEPWPLIPIASLKTTVACLRDIDAGTPVSYSRTFCAPCPMRVAVLCIGYADGYPRALSRKGRVMLHGQWAPQLGNVCMDQMMVDVSHIPDVRPGDVATIIGADKALSQTADDLAAQGGTCMHEILSRLGGRLQRLYYEGGRRVDIR
jgi:alanine racemase